MNNDPLLEPFQLRHLTLRNRIISTAHAPSYHEEGHPRDTLYHDLKDRSRNLGQIDQTAMVNGLPALNSTQATGRYLLARIGDAVAGRNIHAALFDALRICKDI